MPYTGGGEANAAVLGGNAHGAWQNPSEIVPLVEGGEVRALAVSGTRRLDALPDIPTVAELGYEFTWQQPRGIVGPPDMPPEALAFWADAFRKMSETAAWKQYIESNSLTPIVLTGEELIAFLTDVSVQMARALEQMGLKVNDAP